MDTNWKPNTIFTGDNLHVMRGMNSESVDLIYLDPPFNSNKQYAAPIGSEAAGAAFKDTWTLSDVDMMEHNRFKDENKGLYALIASSRETHSKGMFSYLMMMSMRLIEMRRLLKPTGSVYLHYDPTASHYLKLVMDAVFGPNNFCNEIVWDYTFRLMDLPKFFNRKHDVILFYGKTSEAKFSMPKSPWTREEIIRTRKQKIHFDDEGNELIWMPGGKGKSKSRLKKISDIINEGKATSDVWQMPIISSSAKERTGYPTQKPLALLERIVQASSNRGDVVFDPFCGCATALIAAEGLVREWIGIDISPKALDLVKHRMKKDLGILRGQLAIHRTDIPKRTDKGDELLGNGLREHFGALYGVQRGYCNGCNVHFEDRNLEMDHIIPSAKGGTNHADNFQLLCGNCNRRKGTKTQAEFKAELASDKGINTAWI